MGCDPAEHGSDREFGRFSQTEQTANSGEPNVAVVPAISVPSSVACLRSLGRIGVSTIAISELKRPPAFRSKYCDATVSVPSPHDDLLGYRDALLSLVARDDVGTIIPLREEDVYVLAKYRSAFGRHVGTPWPSIETLSQVQDRIRLFQIARDAGVPIPETRLLDEDAEWDRKWIVKSRYALIADEYVEGCSPGNCVAPPSTSYLPPGRIPDVESQVEAMGHTPLLQEYIPTNEEYAFFAMYNDGEEVASFQHRQRRGYSYTGGASAFRESIEDPDLELAGRTLLDALEWHGPAMVEFLRDERTGQYRLMEVNPRFWSSLPFSVRAGADFPAYYWWVATGNAHRIENEYDAGMAGHLIRGELLYLRSVLRDDVELIDRPSFFTAVREIAASVVDHPRFDYLTVDDPVPFVIDMANAFGSATKSHVSTPAVTSGLTGASRKRTN